MKNNKLILALATLMIVFSLISCSGDSSSGDSSTDQEIVAHGANCVETTFKPP
jgi:hypothetical protein